MSTRVAPLALVAKHVRSSAGGVGIVALLVVILAFLATIAPLAVGALGDATVRDRLDDLAPTQTDVVSETVGLPEFEPAPDATTEDVWGPFLEQVDEIRASADAPLPEMLGDPVVAGRTREASLAVTGEPRSIAVLFGPGYEDRIRLVEGSLPEPSVIDTATLAPEGVSVEIVLSTETAEEMGWSVGDSRTIIGRSGSIDVILTGVFAPASDDDDYWQHVPSVLEPNIYDDGNTPRVVTGTGFAHPASLESAYFLSDRQSTIVWFPIDSAGIPAEDAAQTVSGLRKLTSVSHPIEAPGGYGISSLSFDAPITSELDAALGQQTATVGIIAMLIAGPIGVAAAVLALGCRMILDARRSSLRLLSARGTSTGQLRAILGIEGAIAGVVPAALGAVAAAVIGMLVFSATPAVGTFLPAAVVGLAPIAILTALAPSAAERQGRADLGRRGQRLRLIAEAVVTGVAAVALTLLLIRGYRGGVDLLLAATPLLLAIVACLATLHLYPLPLRAVLARARRGRAFDAFLGAARALREPALGLTPVLALLVGVSVAVSSGILLSTLQSGAAVASRAQIGADVRISGGLFFSGTLDRVRAIEGVDLATGISGADQATLTIGTETRSTSVFVADAAELRAVQEDGPGMLPPDVSLEPSDDGVMPLVASEATASDIGGAESVELNGVTAHVVGVTRGPVPIGGRGDWVLIDVAFAEEVLRVDPTDRTILVKLAADADAASVEAALHDELGDAVRIDTAEDIARDIATGPAVQGVRWALIAATAVAALLSALAIVMTLTLAAAPRARVLALLRTLGAPARSSSRLALWEVGPPAVAALIAGTAFGAVVPLVVMAAVDLRPFTGSTLPPDYVVDPLVLGATLGGFVVASPALTTLAILVSHRVRAATALRTVEEG